MNALVHGVCKEYADIINTLQKSPNNNYSIKKKQEIEEFYKKHKFLFLECGMTLGEPVCDNNRNYETKAKIQDFLGKFNPTYEQTMDEFHIRVKINEHSFLSVKPYGNKGLWEVYGEAPNFDRNAIRFYDYDLDPFEDYVNNLFV